MVFSSYSFLFLFLPIVLLAYYLSPRRLRNACLLVFSFIFYGWTIPSYAILLATSIVVSYFSGKKMMASSGAPRKKWLTVGVASNLLLLGYFKYAEMFSTWASNLAELVGGGVGVLPILKVALPIGISFYVFQAISYLVDMYRGDAKQAKSLVSFATYIALFPQLIAGPIVRYRTIAEQLNERDHSFARFLLGTRFFAMGLFKKVVIADTVALGVSMAFGNSDPTTLEAWTGVLCYAFQIYYDFSAYSDMAVGLGLFFGFSFPQNFNSPYQSVSITDFWRRWHISLSSWLRDYLYFPIGGNRNGLRRTYVNLMIVMALGGLWHGASVVFLIWGFWHGGLLALERAFPKNHPILRMPKPLARICVFVLVCIGWVPFRASSMAEVGTILKSMFIPTFGQSDALTIFPEALVALLICAPMVFICKNSWKLVFRNDGFSVARDVLAFWIAIIVILVYNGSPFLYFQF
ncbi:MAG: alginate O-acetyltransferase complex protein AlgI [Planctomycetota bacterium]|jgi:alginate O-acetyltransferase complex protein AlgI